MSTLRTVNIQHPSSSTPSITMDSTGAMTGSFPYPNRNLIYNGAMQIHQRSASVANITTTGYYTADRWLTAVNGTLGTWTQSVENDAPAGSGFRKSLKMLCTTADASPAAPDVMYIVQRLEGQDIQRLAKGTASAQQLTVSFWVKTNVSGTYVVGLYDWDNTRAVSATYTITAGDLGNWVKRTVIFPADLNGILDNDNAVSLDIEWGLGAGSDRTSGTLQTTWGNFVAANFLPGQVNVAAATNNYWQITGVQLEASPVATPFEFKSFGEELAECQRYFQIRGNGYGSISGFFISTSTAILSTSLTVTMRDNPIITVPTVLTNSIDQWGTAARTPSSVAANCYDAQHMFVIAQGMTGSAASQPAMWSGTRFTLSAEL